MTKFFSVRIKNHDKFCLHQIFILINVSAQKKKKQQIEFANYKMSITREKFAYF